MSKVARLDERAVLRISGADAREFLQGLLTHDVRLLAPDRPLWAGLLSPQGKALFDMLLFDGGEGAVLLDVEAARADELARRLSMYRLRRAVEVTPVKLDVYASWGGPHGAMPDARLADLGARWLGDAEPANATSDEYRRYRLSLGVPEGSGDLGVDKTLWLEANAAELGGVSFAKGCYVGQENTARMHHKDRLRRRLLPVVVEGDPGEERGVLADGKAVGELRSIADGVGLAHLRVEEAQGPLVVGEASAGVRWPVWLPRT